MVVVVVALLFGRRAAAPIILPGICSESNEGNILVEESRSLRGLSEKENSKTCTNCNCTYIFIFIKEAFYKTII